MTTVEIKETLIAAYPEEEQAIKNSNLKSKPKKLPCSSINYMTLRERMRKHLQTTTAESALNTNNEYNDNDTCDEIYDHDDDEDIMNTE
mmetsp:Transcript_21782/g.36703  ORF Transcript_21782/g.36703 Transcript_21782/m.36703 type:complete len:89 (+) Transcript_21782:570-836(+)